MGSDYIGYTHALKSFDIDPLKKKRKIMLKYGFKNMFKSKSQIHVSSEKGRQRSEKKIHWEV